MSQEDRFKIQMPAELVSGEISFWFTDGYLLTMSYMPFSLCMPRRRSLLSLPLPIRTPI